MNAKTDRWELYTDKTGKRHWRWPATSAPTERDGREAAAATGQRAGRPLPQQAYFAPLPARGK